ncbi:serine hydrolase [Nicoliella spurrieriana]|uniref:Serine hydrolase n=1 Tax=Nicoliella spurrieriana TaxID=2925830 RepID=A0A976X641_9LACO|nr:serine hydrolase [Nicoliella spurrieriana]UQS87256.1 serine hydrolase [Nicoliella spurrieriana]
MFHNHSFKQMTITLVTAVTLGTAVTTSVVNASYKPDYYSDFSTESLGQNQYITSSTALSKLKNNARAAAAMDANSGKFVYSKNGSKKYAIASTTKIMTLYLAIQKAKKLGQWNHRVKISNSLVKMSRNSALGSFKMNSSSRYTVRSLYKAALIASSNSAAIALGQYVAGSNAKFISMMNKQADAWDIGSQAHFVSSSGLENSDLYPYGFRVGSRGDYNKVSARALTIIAQHLLKLYPSIVNDADHRYAKLYGQTIKNVNELLPGGYSYHSNLNVDGLKTGYTPLAGYCLVSTSTKGNHRLIVTTLHDNTGSKDQARMIAAIYKYSSLFQ